jgi:hypothetical protein
VLGALAVGSLALGAAVVAATGVQPGPQPPPTSAAPAPAWTQGANPDWGFLEVIRTSGMEFSGDWEADLQAAGVDPGRVETFQLRARVCGSAMDDGTGGYHPASQTHGLWLSSFHDEVRRMGRDHGWDTPRIVAYHHCPARFGAVNAVQDLENRAKNP